jgi:predicted Zn-dependent protease with MMP-like domain|tara:strand:+ start:522 stop:731 length:210 start_codon:yes stop_codon:yes gene_type:complete
MAMINAHNKAYNELEDMAEKRFAEHGVAAFDDLPEDVQDKMLAMQDIVLAKWDVKWDEFLNPTPFIGAD